METPNHPIDLPADHPFEVRSARDFGEACIGFNLRKAARRVTRLYEQALVASGRDLTFTQLSILAALWRRDAVPLSRLADDLDMERTSLTRSAAPLVRRGLIDEAPRIDRRERRLRLSEAGTVQLEAVIPHWQSVQLALMAELGPARWPDLQVMLASLAPGHENEGDCGDG